MNRQRTFRHFGAVPALLLGSMASATVAAQSPGEVVRQIDDPHTGIRWLLVRDTEHPGGPGLLIPSSAKSESAASAAGNAAGFAPQAQVSFRPPVVRSGDHLVVEESTAVFETRLDGIALGGGRIGDQIAVRLVLSGKAVRARVIAPGRAALAGEGDAWR